MSKPKRTPVVSDVDAALILGITPPKPGGFEHALGQYTAVLYDSCCVEPIAWGWHIVQTLGDQAFKILQRDADVQCLKKGVWVVVAKWLTPEMAQQKYGPCARVLQGPKGGFKGIVYGTTKFTSSRLKFHIQKR